MTVPVGTADAPSEYSVESAVGKLIALGGPVESSHTTHTMASSGAACRRDVPVCKHWLSRGFCLFGECCAFRHPPECLESLAGERAQLAAQQAALNSSNSGRRGGARPGQRRKEPKNKFRASAFRRFLIDTFGREALQQGTGVLDVAGGRGELAFELLNLNGTPATVVEPRPLDLGRRVKWLMAGFYDWNAVFARYNDRHWGGARPGSGPAAQAASSAVAPWQGAGSTAKVLPQVQQAQQAQQAQPLMPDHLRLVVTPDLAACLTGRLGSNSSSSADSNAGPQSWPRAPPEWAPLLEAARAQARRGEWLHPSAEHGGGDVPLADDALGSEESCESLQGAAQDGSSSGGRSGTSSPEPVATPAPGSPRRRALAWTIPAEDSESEVEGNAPAQVLERQRAPHHAAGGQAAPAPPAAGVHPGPSSEQRNSQANQAQQAQQQQQTLRADPAAVAAAQASAAAACAAAEVSDPAAAWQRFTQCSLVCGMHPDGATEFIVDLALALGKPFAVVPCCVYAAALPRQPGGAASRYEQFLAYLAAKDPAGRIQVATLPFEGRNKVLYRLP